MWVLGRALVLKEMWLAVSWMSKESYRKLTEKDYVWNAMLSLPLECRLRCLRASKNNKKLMMCCGLCIEQFMSLVVVKLVRVILDYQNILPYSSVQNSLFCAFLDNSNVQTHKISFSLVLLRVVVLMVWRIICTCC